MNWVRILSYALFSLFVSLLCTIVFAESKGAFLMWGFVLAIGAGYAYGSFQAFAVAKKEFQKLIDEAMKK